MTSTSISTFDGDRHRAAAQTCSRSFVGVRRQVSVQPTLRYSRRGLLRLAAHVLRSRLEGSRVARVRLDSPGAGEPADSSLTSKATSAFTPRASDRQKHRIALLKRVAGGYDTFMTLRRDRHLSAQPIVDFRGVALYFEPDEPPVDPSKDSDDEPQRGDRTRAASRLRELSFKAVPTSRVADLLR